jgi:hypothetical protein
MQKLPFDLKVGDYCKAYSKGVHKVVDIMYPANGQATTALVSLVTVLDRNLNPCKARKSSCDVYWCKRIDPEKYLFDIVGSHKTQLENVKKFLV